MSSKREQDDQGDGHDSKRTKLVGEEPREILPPSHALLGVPSPNFQGGQLKICEADVGISEYIGHDVSKIEGIIKQRFTDFLVFEVDLDGQIIHIKSLDKPESPQNDSSVMIAPGSVDVEMDHPDAVTWSDMFGDELSPYFSASSLVSLKELFAQGPDPPSISDSGLTAEASTEDAAPPTVEKKDRGRRGRRRGKVDDARKVLSEPIASKADRTSLHQLIRELFKGALDTETDSSASGEDPRIIVKWSRSGGRGGGRGGNRSNRGERSSRGSFPPYIHFTLQKTNRDTQDALNHLARLLHVNVKDLSVAGTKDKRGVTVQRVSLRRHNKTVDDVWRLANSQSSKKNFDHVLTQRAEKGVRIADLEYQNSSLELGMLKGNAFVITLRNVQVDSTETLDKALTTIRNSGFINYYGMQRFGTASVPTHAVGLALLKSEWQKAIDLILETRYGEHPEVEAARKAWLVDRDLDRALALMPRRVVAERCILESYKKQGGDTRNAMGAFSTIPRNLRLMYVHAYQSYVWNAIVSERIRTFGSDQPIVGDLVLENPSEATGDMAVEIDEDASVTVDNEPENGTHQAILSPLTKGLLDKNVVRSNKRSRKPWSPPKVKTLAETDINNYTIFDVVMPLPGTDVSFPGGQLGERYREFLVKDGLDPDNFVRKQREYTLSGSYRKILHLPKEMSWSVLRYTDPDVALAQADEDKLLGFDAPVCSEDGKFMALQIKLTLGTAAYATMALREITKTDTSSHIQTGLTIASEDQKYRGAQLELK